MELNKKNIFSILIVLLFVGSMFVGVAYRPRDNSEGELNTPVEEELDLEPYETSIDANITSKFPKFIISANTSQYDSVVIEKDIKQFKGVKEVSVQFNNADESNIILVATITFDKDYKEEIMEKLDTVDYFENVDVYEYALLEINQNVTFKKTQDENITLDYYIPTKKYEGIVNNSSLVGDNLLVSAQALFDKEDLYSLTLIEMQNMSAAPTFFNTTKNYPIDSWNEGIIVNADSLFSNVVDLDSILDYNFESNYTLKNSLIYDISSLENTLDLSEDMTQNIDQNNFSLVDFSIDENKSEGIFRFEDKLTLEEYNGLKNKLNTEYNLDEFKIIDDLNKTTTFTFYEDDVFIDHIGEGLETNGYNVTGIFKSANVDVSDTNIDDVVYNYDQNISVVQLKYPDNKYAENLDFEISIYATRSDILFLMLNEKQESQDENEEEFDFYDYLE